MSSYFDKAKSEVTPHAGEADELLYITANKVEQRVIKDVLEDASALDFPADLKEKIQKAIAEEAVTTPKGAEWLYLMRYSTLIEILHDLYHQLGSRRIELFHGGLYTDNPLCNLGDKENGAKQAGFEAEWGNEGICND